MRRFCLLSLFLFLVACITFVYDARMQTATVKSGTSLPSTCNPASVTNSLFYKTSTPRGLYRCAATNSWLQLSEVDAKSFGAKGDGTTNDASALQSAVTTTAAANVPLRIRAGTYMVGSQINLDNNSHIIIDKGATLKANASFPSAQTSAVLYAEDKSNITIEGGGTIDCNKAARSTNTVCTPLHIWGGGENYIIRDIFIKNSGQDGSQQVNGGDGLTLRAGNNVSQSAKNVLIENVTFSGNERDAMQVYGCRQCKIINNNFNDTDDVDNVLGPGVGINFEHGGNLTNVTDGVTNGTTTVTSATANFNTILSCGAACSPYITIFLNSSGGMFQSPIASVTNNTTIVLANAVPFSQSGLSMSITPFGFEVFEDMIVSGNTFNNNEGGGIFFGADNLVPVKNIHITNNTFRNNGYRGLSFGVDNGEGVVIAGNTIAGTTWNNCNQFGDGSGLVVSGSVKGVVVSNNMVTGSTCMGVAMSGNSHLQFTNNIITRNGRHGVFLRPDTASNAGNGLSGTLSYNQIFNNSTSAANTYDGIYLAGNAPSRNLGLTIDHNWFGNDPFIYPTATQRYGVYLPSVDVQGITFLFNNFRGNLSGKIVANTGAAINTSLEISDFVVDTKRSLIFSSIDNTGGYQPGGSIFNPPYVPTALSGHVNNYTGINGQAYQIELSGSGGSRNITGIVAGANGERHKIYVTSGTIVFKNEDAASTAANRITTNTGADVSAAAGTTVEIYYSSAYSRWIVVSKYP